MKYTFSDDLVSDLHKDARGFRPGESFYNNWINVSKDEKQSIWDALIKEFNAKVEEENAQEELAIKSFESQINNMIACGAKDVKQAMRWIVDSLGLSNTDKLYGEQYICYKLGLPYSYTEKFTEAGVLQ
jgi:hypothetical protein